MTFFLLWLTYVSGHCLSIPSKCCDFSTVPLCARIHLHSSSHSAHFTCQGHLPQERMARLHQSTYTQPNAPLSSLACLPWSLFYMTGVLTYLSWDKKKNLNQNKENYGWWGKLTSWRSTTRKCCFQIKPHFENPSQHELGGILCLYKWVFLFRTIYIWLDLYFFCILMNEEQMVLSQC